MWEAIFEEIFSENFPERMEIIQLQIQYALWTPNRVNTNKTLPRNIIVKLLKIKDKEKILKEAILKRHINLKGAAMRLTFDVSTEMLEAKKTMERYIYQAKENLSHSRVLYPAKISLKNEDKVKTF